jgi:photosystem II stability/assembly factor-like uncharacterized protein
MGIKEELDEALQVDGFPRSTLLLGVMARLDQRTPDATPWKALAGVAVVMLLGVAVAIIRFAHVAPVWPADHQPPVSLAFAQGGLLSYRFVSSQVGWVRVFETDGRTVIARTSDAGKHWERQLEIDGLSPNTPAKFLSASVALVIGQQRGDPRQGSPGAGFPITIWITMDGGAHWKSRPVPADAGYLISADFVDATHGWLLSRAPESNNAAQSSTVLIYATQDGAQHWTRVAGSETSSALAGADMKVRLNFISQTTGWITSENLTGNSQLYVTRDAGRSWQAQHLPPIGDAGPPSRIHIDVPTFFSPDEGAITVTQLCVCPAPTAAGLSTPDASCQFPSKLFVLSTRDGGRTWSAPRRIGVNATVAFQNSRRWIAVGASGISTSQDAGASWSVARPLPLPSGWTPFALDAIDRNQVWVSIREGVPPFVLNTGPPRSGPINWHFVGTPPKFELITTVDSGAHWEEVPLGGLG